MAAGSGILYKKGDGPIIVNLNPHMRLEAAGGDRQSAGAQPLHKQAIERFGVRRGSRLAEGWPVSSPAVSVKRELGNRQNCPLILGDGEIHLPLGVRKNSQVFEFFGKRRGMLFTIVPPDAEKDTETGANFAYNFLADADPGFGYSLDNGAHGASKRLCDEV